METYGLLLLLFDAIHTYREQLGTHAKALIASGECLLGFVRLVRGAGTNLPAATMQALRHARSNTHRSSCVLLRARGVFTAQAMLDLWARRLRYVEDVDIALPKHHLMVHVIHRAPFHGNPWKYTTFLDESPKKDLKMTLRLCRQCNFEAMALSKLEAVLTRAAKRQRWS